MNIERLRAICLQHDLALVTNHDGAGYCVQLFNTDGYPEVTAFGENKDQALDRLLEYFERGSSVPDTPPADWMVA